MLNLCKSLKIGLLPMLLLIAVLGMFSPVFKSLILNLGSFFILFFYFKRIKLDRNDCFLLVAFLISVMLCSWTYFKYGNIYRYHGSGLTSGGMAIMYTTVIYTVMFIAVVHNDTILINKKNYKIFYDIVYYLFFTLCFKELLLQITRTTLRGVTARGYMLYFGRLHGVDYSVIIILLTILGIKTAHYYTTICFTLLCAIFVPYRTFVFFSLCLIGIYKFHPMMQKIRRIKIFNSYLKIIMWMLMFMFLFILFWNYIIMTSFEIAHQKTALILEGSNAGRFASMLYGIRVIFAKSLYFWGLPDVSDAAYATFADSSFIVKYGLIHPHNSYILMTIQYSVLVFFLYITIISRIFDRLSSKLNDSIILSYMLTACILHNMIAGGRMFMLLSLILLPSYQAENAKSAKRYKFCFLRIKRKTFSKKKKLCTAKTMNLNSRKFYSLNH